MDNGNERRALIAILLSVAVYFFWMNQFAPPPAPNDPPPAGEIPAEVATPAPPPAAAAAPAVVPDQTLELQDPQWVGEMHSAEGALRALSLTSYTSAPHVTPLYRWVFSKITGGDGGWHPYSGGDEPYHLLTPEGGLVLAGAGPLKPATGYALTQEGDVTAATHVGAELDIQKRYLPGPHPFTRVVEVTFTNRSARAIPDLWVGVADEMSGDAGRLLAAIRPLAYVDEDVEHYVDLDDLDGEGVETSTDPLGWYGIGDRYFMAALRPEQPLERLVIDDLGEGRYGAFGYSAAPLDAGASRTLRFTAYIGPKRLDALQPLGPDMEEAVELGWFGFFARILLWLLKIFHAGVQNWGVAILLLTLLVKTLFLPLAHRSMVSGRRMQALQPKLAEMKEKYKDNQQMQAQETMRLFRENNVSPMGGCLPALIQAPVWLALYNVMLYSVELYDSSFLYLKDLTAEDPYGVLPIIYTALLMIQQRMMPMGNLPPEQQQVMKLMPLMFAALMFTFPSGLVLYSCCNILLTIAQQWVINRQIKIDTPAA